MQELDICLPQRSTIDSVERDEVADAKVPNANRACLPCEGDLYRFGKRAFDISLAVLLIPFVVPTCLLLMLLIMATSSGPAFYKHLRIGQKGRPFFLYKFRTMDPDSEQSFRVYLAKNPDAHAEWKRQSKLRFDPRVTPVGRILRRMSLDELPQILNVLVGDMSFVGPRPIVPAEVYRYGKAFAMYAAVKPGITGLWQISGRGNLSYETRISLDVEYVKTWSFLQDVKILTHTPRCVSSSDGAY